MNRALSVGIGEFAIDLVVTFVARDNIRGDGVCMHCHHDLVAHVRTKRVDADGFRFDGEDGSRFDDAIVETIHKRLVVTPRSTTTTPDEIIFIDGFSFLDDVVTVAPDALLLDLGSSHETARIGVPADEKRVCVGSSGFACCFHSNKAINIDCRWKRIGER